MNMSTHNSTYNNNVCTQVTQVRMCVHTPQHYTYCMYTTKLCCLRTENRKKNKNVHHLVHSEESDLGVVVSTLPVLHQTPSLEMPLPPQFISPLFHPYNTASFIHCNSCGCSPSYESTQEYHGS